MSSIVVRRKGYTRKAYTAKRGGKTYRVGQARVKPSKFTIKDRGRKGRGRKVIPPLERGALGGAGFFDRPKESQERIVANRAKRFGERKVMGELRALQVFFKKTDPQKSKRALELSKKVAGSFKGKEYVGYPHGYGRRKSLTA